LTKFNTPIILFIIGLVIFLSQVFSGAIILPQFIQFGPITIRYYGLFIALAVAGGFYLAIKRAERFGLTKRQAEDILFYTIIGGFVGARLYHVLSSWQFYLNHPIDILKVWNGGLSIYGVVFGSIITLLVLQKGYPFLQKRVTLLETLNWLTPSLIVGQIIGRFGNLFNYELYGYPTNLPWKMFVPEMFRKSEFSGQSFFHPLFLYEQLGLLIILWIIGKIGKSEHRESLFFWYLLLYNILRFALEFLRIDSVFWGGFRVNAAVSLILVCISACVIYGNYKRSLDS
jgi:phosphatidylglycerol:prolipoprotein diacylglycerol transferase